MPWSNYHTEDYDHTFVMAPCTYSKRRGHAQYAVVSLRGYYNLWEASAFIREVLTGYVPRKEHYFSDEVYVNSIFIYVELPMKSELKKLRYYLDTYCVLDHISQYEWNVARNDIHQFVHGDHHLTQTVFGDSVSSISDEEDDIAALTDRQMIRLVRRRVI